MISIQPATTADIEALVQLLKILFTIEDDFTFHDKHHRHGLEMMMATKRSCVLTAQYNKQIVGMCSGQITVSTAEGYFAAVIEDVVVTEEFRGRGIGKLLIQGITRWANSKNISRLQLLTDKNNAQALSFYKNVGWQVTNLICLRTIL